MTQGWAVADPDQPDAYGAAEAAARAAAAAPGAATLRPAPIARWSPPSNPLRAGGGRDRPRAAEMTLGAGTLDLRGLVSPPPQWTAAADGPA